MIRTLMEWLAGLGADTVHGIRSLRRSPGVVATIIVTLALGLGLNAATFSFLDQVFTRKPSGIADPEAIHRLWSIHRFGDKGTPRFWPGFSVPEFATVSAMLGGSAKATLYARSRPLRIERGENAPRASVVYAGPGYFELLGVKPAIGRLLRDDESNPASTALVAVISDAFWRRALHSDSAIVGRQVLLGTRQFTVIGVTPPAFSGIDLDATDAWVPLGAFASSPPGQVPWWQQPYRNGFAVLVRPATGISARQVEDRATLALRNHAAANARPVDSLSVARLGSIVEASGPGDAQQEIKVATRLAGVAGIVLLIACANVTNLLLARALRRRREIAVRLALGMSRARVVQLLVVESVLLSVVAAGVALSVAQSSAAALRSLLMPDVHWTSRAVDWRIAVIALLIATVAGIAAALIPAWQGSRPDLTEELKTSTRDGGGRRSKLRSGLLVVQAALSVTLLVGAMLFVQSLRNVHGLDIGFDADRLVFADVVFETADSAREAARTRQVDDIAERLRTVEGVEAVALANLRPMGSFGFLTVFTDKRFRRGEQPSASYLAVSPDYFEATGLRTLRGTGFAHSTGTSPREVVINDAMANAFWPGEDPIGRCMRFEQERNPCYVITGVVSNARVTSVIEEDRPQYYLPIDNQPVAGWPGLLVIRVAPERAAAVEIQARQLIREMWPTGEPRISHMAKLLEPQYRPWKLGATLFSTFGILALIISVVGIYSTVSYDVSQRTREFGVRVALGARVGDVLRHVVGEGLRTVAIGVVLGVLLVLAGGRLITALLYEVSPGSPRIMIAVSAVLLSVAGLAALLPAWRASRVDPMNALRTE